MSVAKRLQEGGFRLVVGRAGLVTNSGYFPHMSMIVKVKLISSFDINLHNLSKLNLRKTNQNLNVVSRESMSLRMTLRMAKTMKWSSSLYHLTILMILVMGTSSMQSTAVCMGKDGRI